MVTTEELAKSLHEALRGVRGELFTEWTEISEPAREDRRRVAEYVIKHYCIITRRKADQPNPLTGN